MFSNVTDLKPEDRGIFTTVAVDMLRVITQDLLACAQLTELQQLRTQAEGIQGMGATSHTYLFCNSMADLFAYMVNHIVKHGRTNINDDWKTGNAPSLRVIKGLWEIMERDGTITRNNAAAAPVRIVWTEDQLSKCTDKRVRELLQHFTSKLPELTEDSDEQQLLRWILIAARVVLNLDVIRAEEAIYERIWRDLPVILVGKIPMRHESLIANQLQQRSPYALLETMIAKTKGMVESALQQRRKTRLTKWQEANFGI